MFKMFLCYVYLKIVTIEVKRIFIVGSGSGVNFVSDIDTSPQCCGAKII